MVPRISKFAAGWATILIEGRKYVPQDHQKAFEIAQIGAKKRCPASWGVLARCFYNGYGCSQDKAKAFHLAKKSADAGSCYGYFILGWNTYDEGQYSDTIMLWQKAADLGLAAAQVNLGFMFANGEGVRKDEKKAFQLYEMAADKKHPEGYVNLSRMYSRGIGVEHDYDKASHYACLAREAGNSRWLHA